MVLEKHLDFIQAVITRLAGNSFQMKAWNVALASATIGFAAARETRTDSALLALVPSMVFWTLDAYYLGLEQAFRDLYAETVKGTTMAYSLSPTQLSIGRWFQALFSPSVLLVHATMAATIWAASRFA